MLLVHSLFTMSLRRMFFVLAFLSLGFLAACSASGEASINAELKKANYCEKTEDCVFIGSKCPFDCAIYVNAKEAGRMKGIVDAYQSTCMYACLPDSGVECRDHVCTPIREESTGG